MSSLTSDFLAFFSKRYAAVLNEKKNIRLQVRRMKKDISDEQKQLAANAVFDKIELMPEFIAANSILIYWAISDELPTQEAIMKWSKEKNMLLPSIVNNKLVLKHFFPAVKLVQKELGIWEPDLVESYDGIVDLVIVPGIAFDKNKNRLGRGKGYYDRFFKKYKPLKIGVGFDFQLMNSIPVARHDIKMNKIVTPSDLIE